MKAPIMRFMQKTHLSKLIFLLLVGMGIGISMLLISQPVYAARSLEEAAKSGTKIFGTAALILSGLGLALGVICMNLMMVELGKRLILAAITGIVAILGLPTLKKLLKTIFGVMGGDGDLT